MDTITLNPPRARRRRYSREFKAKIVETCKQPGTSVAAIARMHDINDNIVHRWLRESAQNSTDSRLLAASFANLPVMPTPAFVPIQPDVSFQNCIHLELVKHDLTLRIDWPAAQAHSCLQMLLALLR